MATRAFIRGERGADGKNAKVTDDIGETRGNSRAMEGASKEGARVLNQVLLALFPCEQRVAIAIDGGQERERCARPLYDHKAQGARNRAEVCASAAYRWERCVGIVKVFAGVSTPRTKKNLKSRFRCARPPGQ
ncbi:uncharacterized protein UV8b_01739 [Ustilaginoidea virens]|uniref:Uncharacterized protein n=1 Tax=Ustilaginoidea virens TaxID=1159556 RepID=A0A8E5HLH9_USTVR|nr:uncharacterized protein UV8b_01739 [Ustilaginoidea virens]QUC17498.1 hypothetical protein UV8b_01739 [Ustilaginoidea virens]